MLRNIVIITIFLFSFTRNVNANTSFELPKVMFVTAEAGLRIRSEPTTASDIVGFLLYGERIIIHEKSDNSTTIDGITDHWYRIYFRGDEPNWIFGGYISENLPGNLPIILGLWDDINSPFVWGYFRVAYRFNPNYQFTFFIKETGHVVYGAWEIKDNTIRIFDIKQNEGHIGVNYTEEYIQLEIIDNNNIVLTFLNNAPPAFVNSNKTIELRRSPDTLW